MTTSADGPFVEVVDVPFGPPRDGHDAGRRADGAERAHHGRGRGHDLDAFRVERGGQPLDVAALGGADVDGDLLELHARVEGVLNQVHAVEQQQAVDVAMRHGAVACDDGILAAGDAHGPCEA